jgi:hypothetical protein
MESLLRRVLFALMAIAFLGILVYLYLQVTEKKPLAVDRMAGIPPTALLIAEFHEPAEIFRRMHGKSEIWSLFTSTTAGKSALIWLQFADSLTKTWDLETGPSLSEFTVVLAPAGAGKTSWLYLLRVAGDDDQRKALLPVVNRMRHQFQISEREYDGRQVLFCKNDSIQFFAALVEDVLLISPDQLLLEESIRLKSAGEGPQSDAQFASVAATAGQAKPLHLYLHPQRLWHLLGMQVKQPSALGKEVLQNVSGWVEMDAVLRGESIIFNGYGWAPDSLDFYGSRLQNQRPGGWRMAEVLPINTALMYHLHVSDLSLPTSQRTTPTTDSAMSTFWSGWTGTEAAFILTAPQKILKYDADLEPLKFFIVRIADEEVFAAALAANHSKAADSITISANSEIHRLSKNDLVEGYFGNSLPVFESEYVAKLSDYAVFATTSNALHRLAEQVAAGQVLEREAKFREFTDHLTPSAHLSLYVHPSRLTSLMQVFTGKPLDEKQDWLPLLLDRLQGFAWQFVKEERQLLYQSAYIRSGIADWRTSGARWEIQLEAPIESGPWIFPNHNSGEREILVQDQKHQLYLIDKEGDILWKRQVDGPVLGEVQVIDKLHNKKFQMLFNTPYSIWQLDRNGKELQGFPLLLPDTVTLPLSLANYDNKGNYRIFIPKGSDVICMDIDGKEVKGWKYEAGASPVCMPQHYVSAGKDYLVFPLQDGSIRALNRQGKQRLQLNKKIGLPYFGLIEGKDLKQTFLVYKDSTGNIKALSLTDEETSLTGKEPIENNVFLLNLGSSRLVGVVSNDKLKALDLSGNIVWQAEIEEKADGAIPLIPRKNQGVIIHYADRHEAEVLNSAGVPLSGSPYSARSSAISIQFENNGKLCLVADGDDAWLRCFELEQ